MKKPLPLAVVACPSKWDFPKSFSLKEKQNRRPVLEATAAWRFTAPGERSHHRLLLELSCEFANEKWDSTCACMLTVGAQVPSNGRSHRHLFRQHLSPSVFWEGLWSHSSLLSWRGRERSSQSWWLIWCYSQKGAGMPLSEFPLRYSRTVRWKTSEGDDITTRFLSGWLWQMIERLVCCFIWKMNKVNLEF